jgi:hypothetical protein
MDKCSLCGLKEIIHLDKHLCITCLTKCYARRTDKLVSFELGDSKILDIITRPSGQSSVFWIYNTKTAQRWML